MDVPRLNAWYDAELETGNNLGRFANQPHVQEALESMKRMSASHMPEVTESDWKRIEDDLDSYCNAEYKCIAGQLVLVAKRDLQPTRQAEVFVNYGGLWSYWLRGVRQTPDAFPERM